MQLITVAMAGLLLAALTLGCAAVANAAFVVPTPAPFPELNVDKHHILTAPQIVIDGEKHDRTSTSGHRSPNSPSTPFLQAS